MKYPVLVLNADYVPHRVTTWQNAFVHIYSKDENSAHIVATYPETVVDSMGRIYNIPAVIVLNNYVKNSGRPCTYSKHAVHIRDKNTCQYCGRTFSLNQLNIDHIVPQCQPNKLPKGVKMHSFENCVSSCKGCNSKKADKTLKEAGMLLRSIPKPLSKAQKTIMEIKSKRYPAEWKPYIENL